jgi:hypothetical protein
MTLDELKRMILKLPREQLHDLRVWANRLEYYGDIPHECLNQLAAEIWDQDDRRVSPTHPATIRKNGLNSAR